MTARRFPVLPGRDARARPPRPVLALIAALGAVLLVAGCGIRATEGPINAGDPARRPSTQGNTASPGTANHAIYLIRDGRPQAVQRGGAVVLPTPARNTMRPTSPHDPERWSLIVRLLLELGQGPSADEAAQGWSTALPPGGVKPADPLPNDPVELVRLDLASLDALDPLALGQIVCTLQHAAKSHPISFGARQGPGVAQDCAAFGSTPAAPPTAARTAATPTR
ncbi:MAG TPA: hypothetical protein VLH10_21735 [Yinghuangia sp.]|nr:hypothetical protein [Yinghuangia sp.]